MSIGSVTNTSEVQRYMLPTFSRLKWAADEGSIYSISLKHQQHCPHPKGARIQQQAQHQSKFSPMRKPQSPKVKR
jgi:hypothetical protein